MVSILKKDNWIAVIRRSRILYYIQYQKSLSAFPQHRTLSPLSLSIENGKIIMCFNSLIRRRSSAFKGRTVYVTHQTHQRAIQRKAIPPSVWRSSHSHRTTSSYLLPENYELARTMHVHKHVYKHNAEERFVVPSLLGCRRCWAGKSLPVYKRDYTRT